LPHAGRMHGGPIPDTPDGTGFAFRDPLPGDAHHVRRIARSVIAEYGLPAEAAGSGGDVADINSSYLRRGGLFRIVTDAGGRMVGCGGLFPLTRETAEIRRMYLLPEARGRHLGRQLLDELLEGARTRGVRRVVLGTASVFREAIGLYRSAGFVPSDPPPGGRCDCYFGLDLVPADGAFSGAAMDILRFLKISERISTSGQPQAEQFAAIARQGFGTVINLAVPDSSNAIADEGSVVARAGMNYVNIPVAWEAPRVEQFLTFVSLMDGLGDQKIWVHCAMNMRVSCFFYLYHTEFGGMAENEARALMNRIWDPDSFPQWKQFIADVRARAGK